MPRGSSSALAVCALLAIDVNAGSPSLSTIVDVPLPGGATRCDYQSFDPKTKTLYLSHMGDGELVVFNTSTRTVTAHVPGFPTVTGVLAVPELHRVFASAVSPRSRAEPRARADTAARGSARDQSATEVSRCRGSGSGTARRARRSGAALDPCGPGTVG